MTTVEIGRGKSGRRAYALDEIGIVPSRRTRHPEEVSIAWQIDAYRFDLPLVVCPMDSVVSPQTAVLIGRLGGLAVLDLEGLWTRYEDPEPLLAEVTELGEEAATRRLQEIYAAPIKEDLIGRRIEEIRAAGVVTAARLSPAANRSVLQGRYRRGRRYFRHSRHHRVRRACLRAGRAAQPQAVHLRARRPGHRGRLRHLHRGAASHEDRGRRGPRRVRRRLGAHHGRGAWRRRADGHRDRRCGRRAA